MGTHRLDMAFRRFASMAISASIAATLGSMPVHAHAADTIQTLATSFQPALSGRVDASGFKHPGMGLTKDQRENMRTQVRAQQEPWNTYFNQMLMHPAAFKTPTIKNVMAPIPPSHGSTASIRRGLKPCSLRMRRRGDETYRANAMRILRLYEQMDPARHVYYVDSHIHAGIPLSRMVGAAEILRYTSIQTPALEWADNDTVQLTNNLVVPVVQTFNSCNCRFMKQHLYTTLAAMSGAIFTDNLAEYNESVEWFFVNKDAAVALGNFFWALADLAAFA